jgi:hypothetical protein
MYSCCICCHVLPQAQAEAERAAQVERELAAAKAAKEAAEAAAEEQRQQYELVSARFLLGKHGMASMVVCCVRTVIVHGLCLVVALDGGRCAVVLGRHG